MKNVVVFDLDGTLAHTEVYWLPILDRTLAEIERRFGIQRSIEELTEALPLLGKPDEAVFAGLFPGQSRSGYLTMIDLANEVWLDMLDAHPFVLYPGVLEVLKQLTSQGYELFLASNCDEFYLTGLLNTGLRPYITDASCVGLHPGLEKWEFTQLMLSKIGEYKGYFVGDSGSDMKAGRKNGLTTVYATYGYGLEPDAEWIEVRIEGIGEMIQVVSVS